MNRERKYRVWDISHKTFLPTDVYALITSDFGAFGIMLKDWDNYKECEYLYPNSQIQSDFTGLLDKNGKEIFADDLLKDEHGVIFRIYHVAGGFIMKANYWKANCKELNATDELIYCPLAESQNKSWLKYSCEIIGNIYENPNLIN